MSFQASTPAAKRRRVEDANSTLRKPFRSPLINRPKPATAATADSDVGPVTSTPSAGQRDISRVPSTPSRLSSQLTRGPAVTSNSLAFTPVRKAEGSSSSSIKTAAPSGRVGGGSSKSTSGSDDLLGRMNKAQKEMTAHLSEMQKELDLIRQAKRIEQSSQRKIPGGEVDGELRELIEKWKQASRQAADELFELIRGRVDGMGGAQAWRASRRRQLNFYGDQQDQERNAMKGGRRGDDDDYEGREEVEGREREGGDDYESERGEEGNCEGTGDGHEEEAKDEDDDTHNFTMLMMLTSLTIEPDLLGWDSLEDKWKE
ncbi:hypothetical protein QBC46DRAFT_433786 [Diplogelasinospora grovesii]|uniref:Swi5-dependent recombination DNA repair protein 1 n=1 Tax=Diplogelasinospora grovesii TaxID=303347 RepID=A0AAN6NIK2_9PEZI|nr:hypothetical protein QBC46DRAFT_433786 [Diplogelasinospora grovesii]